MAEGGTLFLDEIANVPLSQQNKLLRVLETGDFERLGSSRTRRANVRLISATNADLHAEVAAGRFRQDLLFRINTIELRLPALRERREDIPALAMHFLQRRARHYRKAITGFDPSAMQALLEHPWPGNVRELDHAIERAVLMAQGSTVKASDLGLRSTRTRRRRPPRGHEPRGRRVLPDQEGDEPLRRQRQPRRPRPRPEPQRALSPPAALRAVS